MDFDRVYDRYRELQRYVGWGTDDVERIVAAGPLLEPHLPALIDDFYAEIERHPGARKVITGGPEQIERLKGTLRGWVRELLEGRYEEQYVERRWRVGWRHVEIGLDQVYSNAALSRLRAALAGVLRAQWQGDLELLYETTRSLNKLLDLDLAIIEDAYQAEHNARLQRNERLATLGQVAGGVAHELRNPLNVVKTSVYYLLNARAATPGKKAEHLSRIERQIELADSVITALSNFARMPIPSLNATSIPGCIGEALEVSSPGPTVELSLELPERFPSVLADGDQLRIVFTNLIRNACDAMPQAGRLTIAGRVVDSHVEVSFSDTGIGISPEDHSRIMEPLYSTKARGLGLGLAIARSIVEKNQGSLHVESQAGLGSTFTVRLSIAPLPGEPVP